MRETLEPFAKEAENWADDVATDYRPLQVEPQSVDRKQGGYAHPGSDSAFSVGDLRRARSELEGRGWGLISWWRNARVWRVTAWTRMGRSTFARQTNAASTIANRQNGTRPCAPLGVGHRPARMIALRQVHRRRVGRREGARKNTCDAQNLC